MSARHGHAAVVVGSKRPAMSISWEPPSKRSGGVDFFVIFFSDLYPGDPGFEDLPEAMVCLHCLIEQGDEQLGRGLDLARLYGQVDYDPDDDEWFVPDHAAKGEA